MPNHTIKLAEAGIRINENRFLFTEALTTQSYQMDNNYFYHFRPIEVHEKKTSSSKEDKANLNIPVVGMAVPSSIIPETIQHTLDNIKVSKQSVNSIYHDTHLYSDTTKNDIVTNAAKLADSSYRHYIKKKYKQKGSRVKLNSSQPIDFENATSLGSDYDYLVYWWRDQLYHIHINENNYKKIIQKYIELLTEDERKLMMKNELTLNQFKAILKNHFESEHIQHGWTDAKTVYKLEPHKWVGLILIGKSSKKAVSSMLSMGVFLTAFTPVLSVFFHMIMTQYVVQYVFVEQAKAAYRKEHLGRNPTGDELKAIQREGYLFRLQAFPFTIMFGYELIKTMQYTNTGLKPFDTSIGFIANKILDPIDKAISHAVYGLLRSLSLEVQLGIMLLTCFSVAIAVTGIALVTQGGKYHQKKHMGAVFALGFMAGLLCFASSTMHVNTNLFGFRAGKELIFSSGALALAFGLYNIPSKTPTVSLSEEGTHKTLLHIRKAGSFKDHDNKPVIVKPMLAAPSPVTHTPV